MRALLADPATTEVVVTVDGSRDESYELATRLGTKDSRVVAFEQAHAGTRAARSAGVKKATGDVVLLMDDDVVAGEHLVTGHALRHRDVDHLVVVGYMPVVATDSDSAIRALSRIYAHEYESHCDEIEADRRLILLHLWGGNVSLRRADYLSIDYLEADTEAMQVEHEDQYLGVRCHQTGLTGVFDRTLYAEHRHQRDAEGFLRSARIRAMAKWQLHSLFPEFLGVRRAFWSGGRARSVGCHSGAKPLSREAARSNSARRAPDAVGGRRVCCIPVGETCGTPNRHPVGDRFVVSDTGADQRAQCLIVWGRAGMTGFLAYNFGAAGAACTGGSASAFDSVPEAGRRLPQ